MKKIFTFLPLVFCLNSIAQIVTTVAGNGTLGYSGDAGLATAAELNAPVGVTLDASGNMYIADFLNSRIRKVSTSGIITTIAGSATSGFSGDGGAATAAQLKNPYSVALDNAGNIFIADFGNNRIRKINTSGIISTISGTGYSGSTGDGGAAIAAAIYFPIFITFDDTGNLYISEEAGNRIRKINTGGIITTIVGDGIGAYNGDGGQATAAEVNSPRDIVFDNAGNLFFADEINYCIRKINTAGIISTIIGTGTSGFSGDGGQATLCNLNQPIGLALDNSNNFYIGDVQNYRIRKVNSSGIITTIAGNGVSGYSGDGGQATLAEVNQPVSITLDAIGNLYFADNYNERVRKIDIVGQTTNIQTISTTNAGFTIYPNPTSTNFTLETNSTDKQTLQIFDVNGKLVLTQTITGKTTIDASNLAEGVYNLSLVNANGVINKRLIIIK